MYRLLPKRSFFALQALIAVFLIIAACARQMPTLPVIGTPGNSLPGKVVWHDLVTPNPDKSRAFYGQLFGWQFEQISDGYVLARSDGRPVAGMARVDAVGQPSHWLPLVSVKDIARAQETTRAADGKVALDAFELPGRGRVAVLKDPQGAAFGVLQSSHGDPEDRVPALNTWMWNEIWTDDLAAAADYYEKLFGYELATANIRNIDYEYFERDGKPRAGLLKKPDPGIPNTWLCYLRVADVASVTNKARALGATVLMAPNPSVRNGKVAILADPHGAGFVVQEWRK
jgi:predicted enzyme related to lactoylglutathione lyase